MGFGDGSLRELVVTADDPPAWRDILPGPARGLVRAILHAGSGGLWVLRAGRVQRFADLQKPWHEHWEELPFMPAGNHDNIFARIGDRLYTAGGKTFFGWPANEWVNLDHVWSYHVPSGTWRVEAPMLEPGKAYSGIAVLEDELWLLGGLFRHGEGDATRPTATVEIFDPATQRYRLGPPLPQKAGQVVALTAGGRLYGVGGAGEEGPVAQLLSIGPGETDWRVDAPPPGPVYQASGCVLDDRIYIAAGPKSQCPGLFVYDPGRDHWSEVEHPVKAPNAPPVHGLSGSSLGVGRERRRGPHRELRLRPGQRPVDPGPRPAPGAELGRGGRRRRPAADRRRGLLGRPRQRRAQHGPGVSDAGAVVRPATVASMRASTTALSASSRVAPSRSAFR